MRLSGQSAKSIAARMRAARSRPLRKWWERLQFTLLFVLFTLLLHAVLVRFHGWLEPADRYREPAGGRASKVLATGAGADPAASPGDRLRLFYWLGE